MAKIIQLENSMLAVVVNPEPIPKRFLKAREEIEEHARDNMLKVADMPMAIQLMTNYPKVREVVRPWYLHTVSSEYYGQRNGKQVYEVWHSVGSLSTLEGLNEAFNNQRGKYGFMAINNNEWVDVGNKKFLGQDVVRVHLEDVKKDNIRLSGTPYTIFVPLDLNKNYPRIHEIKPLNYDEFMKDDRLLMLEGSLENREAVANMLFGAEKDGGEGRSSVYNFHRKDKMSLNTTARGTIVGLQNNGLGFGSDLYDKNNGRFLAVSEGVFDKSAEKGSKLDQILGSHQQS